MALTVDRTTGRRVNKRELLFSHLRQNINSYKGKSQREMATMAGEALGVNVSFQEVSKAISDANGALDDLRSAQSLLMLERLGKGPKKAPTPVPQTTNNGPVEKPMSVLEQLEVLRTENRALTQQLEKLPELEAKLKRMAELLGIE